MKREEKVKNLLTELIDFIDNGSQRDLDRADEIAKTILEIMKEALENQKTLQTELEKIIEYAQESMILRDNPYNNATEYSVSMSDLINIIGKRISELKGENK